MHSSCILARKQVIKLMLKYELIKIFSKRINRVVLVAALAVTIIYSGLAIGSMSYTDEEGQSHTGIEAGRLLAEDINQWKGDLTTEKISEVINSYKELSAKYPDGIPDTEWGKQVQSYYDIKDFVIKIMTPDSEWDESVLSQLSDEQLQDIYTIYQDNMKKMAEEYGTTPEKRSYLESIYEKVEIPLTFEAKDSWDTMTMYAQTYVLLVTVKMRTPNLAVCIPFFLQCMMPFIARALPSFDAFFNLMPTTLTNVLNTVRAPILVQIGPFVFQLIPFVMVLYGVLSVGLLPLIYRSYSRYGIKKRYGIR